VLRSVPKGSIGRVEGRVRSPAAGAHPDSPGGAAGGHAASPSMRLDLSTLRAPRLPGQTEHPSTNGRAGLSARLRVDAWCRARPGGVRVAGGGGWG
jgi:hypothetical protein